MTALLLLNRVRWSGKTEEANVFRYWLLDKLVEGEQNLEDVKKEHAPLLEAC